MSQILNTSDQMERNELENPVMSKSQKDSELYTDSLQSLS